MARIVYLKKRLTKTNIFAVLLALFAFLSILFFSASAVFAAYPATKYAPGETLNPSCAPGDANCGVEQLSVATSTLNYGIGTTTPYAKLSVVGEIVGAYFTGTTTATSTFGGNITISGTGTSTSAGGINLSAGCFAISGACLGSGTSAAGGTGAVQFANGTALTGDATNFFWDDTLNYLGIGTSTPQARLSVVSSATSSSAITLYDPLGGASLELRAGTSTLFNTFVGVDSGHVNITGGNNSAHGYRALYSNTTGSDNTANGFRALYNNTTGSTNTAFGASAGRFITDGSTGNNTSGSSLYLGYDTRAQADGDTNEIVIGASTIGNGSNSVTLGNTSITKTVLQGTVGIGTTTPYAKLSVVGQVAAEYFTATSTNATSTFNGGIAGVNNFVVQQTTGNLGIGTITPSARLAINNTSSASGPELITNGTFTGNATGWTLGDCAVYGTNRVTVTYTACTAPRLSTTFASVSGTTYLLTFTVSGSSNDVPYYYFTSNSGNYEVVGYANGTYTVAFTANYTGSDTLTFESWNWNSGGAWTIDDVSLKSTTVINPALAITGYDGATYLSLGGSSYGNIAVGKSAGSAVTTGDSNIFLGDYAGKLNTTGSSNSIVGANAFRLNTTGGSNTATGMEALFSNTTGSHNTAIGVSTLYSNTTGASNIAIGNSALISNTTGGSNIALGRFALDSNTTGSNNVTLGISSLTGNTTGSSNTVMGYKALFNPQTGGGNSALGQEAGYGVPANSFASSTLLGYRSGYGLTTGSRNILLGYQAGDAITSGQGNIILGYDIDAPSATGNNQLNIGNLLFGTSLDGTGTTLSTGNIGIGTSTPGARLSIVPSATSSSAITLYDPLGNASLEFRVGTSSLSNAYIGVSAGSSNTTGNQNVAIGTEALFSITTGVNNNAQGYQTLYSNTSGGQNTANGTAALRQNTTGSRNTVMGWQALYNNTTGTDNTVIGRLAGRYLSDGATTNTTASDAVYIGSGVKALAAAGSNEIVIGSGAIGNGSNSVTLGSASIVTTVLRGSVGVGTTTPGTRLSVVPSATSSSAITLYDPLGNASVEFRASTSTLANTFVGVSAGSVNTTGNVNSAFGYQALTSNTSGGANTANGTYALFSDNGGSYNSASGAYALYFNVTGMNNTGTGYGAMFRNTTGSSNTAYGSQALYYNRTGDANTAIGQEAGAGVVLNSFASSTLLGYRAGYGLTTGSSNTLLGYQAGDAITTGQGNIVLGYDIDAPSATGNNQLNIGNLLFGTSLDGTGTTLSTGNIGIGTSTPRARLSVVPSATSSPAITLYDPLGNASLELRASTSTLENTFIGVDAGNVITTGSLNTAVGNGALISNTTASSNTAVGWHALSTTVGGIANTAVGRNALSSNVNGTQNIGIGYFAGRYITDGVTLNSAPNNSVFLGYDTRANAASDSNEIVIGASAIGAGSNSVTLGNTSIVTTVLQGSVGVGTSTPGVRLSVVPTATSSPAITLYDPLGNASLELRASTSTLANTYVGLNAGLSNTTGTSNTALGKSALYTNTTGIQNTAIGSLALGGNTTGADNIAIGVLSLFTNTSGSTNVSIGDAAMLTNTTGANNNAIGANALGSNTTGLWNVALGTSALYRTQTGTGNAAVGEGAGYGTAANSFASTTLFGYHAGYGLSTGSRNILLGYQAGDAITTGQGNIVLGYDIDAPSATGNNQLNIGNLLFGTSLDGTGTTYSTGNIGIGTSTPAARLSIIGTATSSSVVTLYDPLGSTALEIRASTSTLLNTLIGVDAGKIITTGSSNTAVGNGALIANTTAGSNTAMGWRALGSTTIGGANVAIGRDALFSNVGGGQNIGIGYFAGRYLTDGATSNSTPNNSVFLGYDTRANAASGSNEIVIGASAIGAGSNSVTLGNTSITKTILRGNVGIGTTTPTYALSVEGVSTLGNQAIGGYFTATSTTATSTFGGFIDVNGTGANATSTIASNLWVKGTLRAAVSYVGDLVFSNNFRFVERDLASSTQALYLNNQFGSTTLAVLDNGNVGIGTTSPVYRLNVEGDVAATGFVNTSTKDAKKDIVEADPSEGENALSKIRSLFVAHYRYNAEDESVPLRTGLIAEEAPDEVLSPDGKGVDLYKFVTFLAIGMKTLIAKVDALQVSVAALSANTSASVSGAVSGISGTFTSLLTDKLTVGSPSKRTGITLYDEENGAPYCLSISGGSQKVVSGECQVVSPAPTPESLPMPIEAPSTTPSLSDSIVVIDTTMSSTTSSLATSSEPVAPVTPPVPVVTETPPEITPPTSDTTETFAAPAAN